MDRRYGSVVGTLVAAAWLAAIAVLWSAMSAASSDSLLSDRHATQPVDPALRGDLAHAFERGIRGEPGFSGATSLGAELKAAFGVPEGRLEPLMAPLYEAARGAGVPVELYAALVMTESSFRADVLSHAGAVGPAQVTPKWWAGGLCSGMDLLVPADNLRCGAQVLARYHRACGGDWACALWRYNVGPGALERDEPGARDAGRRYEAKVAGWLRKLGSAGRTL